MAKRAAPRKKSTPPVSVADYINPGTPRRRGYELEAAASSRLNEKHWAAATDTPINSLLQAWLPTLRARCTHECLNNSDVEGCVNTLCDDIVGADGFCLQVQSSSSRYNKRMEEAWASWFYGPDALTLKTGPDINRRMTGPTMLRLWIRQLCTCGEFLAQIVSDPDTEPGHVAAKIRCIHPRRLETSPSDLGASSWILGVQINQWGRPIQYSIENTPQDQIYTLGLRHLRLPAQQVIHEFIPLEPDQVRGLPWLMSSLPIISELRDYDTQVMDAARVAADFCGLLTCATPDGVSPVTLTDQTEIPRRTLSAIPPGYHLEQMKPEQPANTYKEFREEKLRALGRPFGMPLMMIMLDSRNHNYSSARFDSQIYQRVIRSIQSWLMARVLNRMIAIVAREVELMPGTPKRPADVAVEWIPPKFPHVDPLKEASAATERLNNGTSCLRDECAAIDKDWEDVQAQRKREGLPPALTPATGATADIGDDTDDEEGDEDAE